MDKQRVLNGGTRSLAVFYQSVLEEFQDAWQNDYEKENDKLGRDLDNAWCMARAGRHSWPGPRSECPRNTW